MKFGKQLQREGVEEWREFYVSYKKLKRVLKKAELQIKAPRADTDRNPLIPNDVKKEFFDILDSDIKTFNSFFFQKLEELKTRFQEILNRHNDGPGGPTPMVRLRPTEQTLSKSQATAKSDTLTTPLLTDQSQEQLTVAVEKPSNESTTLTTGDVSPNTMRRVRSYGSVQESLTTTQSAPIKAKHAPSASGNLSRSVQRSRQGTSTTRMSKYSYTVVHDGHDVNLSDSPSSYRYIINQAAAEDETFGRRRKRADSDEEDGPLAPEPHMDRLTIDDGPIDENVDPEQQEAEKKRKNKRDDSDEEEDDRREHRPVGPRGWHELRPGEELFITKLQENPIVAPGSPTVSSGTSPLVAPGSPLITDPKLWREVQFESQLQRHLDQQRRALRKGRAFHPSMHMVPSSHHQSNDGPHTYNPRSPLHDEEKAAEENALADASVFAANAPSASGDALLLPPSVTQSSDEVQRYSTAPVPAPTKGRTRSNSTGNLNVPPYATFHPHHYHNRSAIEYSALSQQQLDLLKTDILRLYHSLVQLQTYRELNNVGVKKILKKFDKLMKEDSTQFALDMDKQPFYASTEILEVMHSVQQFWNEVSGDDNIGEALQEFITAQQNNSGYTLKSHVKWRWLALGLVLMGIFLAIPIFPSNPFAKRCLALLAVILTAWVTEAVPFFVTAVAIPFFTVLLEVMVDPNNPGHALKGEDASKLVFGKMFSDTVMLVLGGFSISSAFSKYHFELQLAHYLQVKLGHRPRLFLLAFMLLGFFLSMWISNVAAPLLCTAVMLPILRDFSRSSAYAKALLLGLAFACNVGGMLTPIASPQNAVAIQYLPEVSFAQWCYLVIPYGLICCLSSWVYIILVLKPNDVPHIPEIVFEKERMSRPHYIVIAVSGLTIALWCTLSITKDYVGDMGNIAVIPFITFFGLGILTREDLKGFSWNLILLLGGGSVLGAAVQSSGLLHAIADAITPTLKLQTLWVATLLVASFVLVASTFVSHTVVAIIVMPMVVEIGTALGQAEVITMAAALMCSGSMSLPMTSFPNLNALVVTDDYAKPYLHVRDFLVHGTPNTLFTLFWLMSYAFFVIKASFH